MLLNEWELASANFLPITRVSNVHLAIHCLMGGILRFSLVAFPLEVNNVDHLNFDVCLVLYLSRLVFLFLTVL